jgi:hypothetical protein
MAAPATTCQITTIPQISAPGRLEPVRRQVQVAMMAAIASSSPKWMATIEENEIRSSSEGENPLNSTDLWPLRACGSP